MNEYSEQILADVIDDMRDVILEYEQDFVKDEEYAKELLVRVASHCYDVLEELEDMENEYV